MGKKRIVLWFSLLVLFFAARLSAQTDGYTRMYGLSSRSAAMGGAMVGIAEGIDALAYNPAALALTRNSVSVQVQYFADSKLMVNDTNCGPGGVGIVAGLTQRALRDRLGFGFAFTQSGGGGGGGGGGGLSLLGGGGGYSWPMYGGASLPISYGIALRLHDTLGVGIMPASNLWIRTSPIELGLGQILQSVLGMSIGAPSTDVNPNIGLGLSFEDLRWSFSVAWRPLKYVSFGYQNIPSSKVRLRVPLVIRGGGIIDDIRSMILSDISTSPPIQQYGVGVHIPLPKSNLTLAWSQQLLGFGKLYDELYGDYLKYDDPALKNAVSVGYGAPTPIKDAVVNRFGAEYVLGLACLPGVPKAFERRNAQLALRGGYFQWKSPLPESLHGRSFDNDANVYSMGLGFAFDRASRNALEKPMRNQQFSVDMHVQYIDLAKKDYQLQYDYWGSPMSPGDLYYFHTEGQIWVVGLTLNWLH
jgi:hypothetical protein